MTDEQKAAYIMAQAACVMAETAAMQAENMQREHLGQSMTYNEDHFVALIAHYGIHHNAVLSLFQG